MRCSLAVVLIGVVVAGCAATERVGSVRDDSGPVAWEFTNLRQTREEGDTKITWWYTLVLRNTSASAITFRRRVTTGMIAPGESFGGQGTEPFDRELKAGDELRLVNQTFSFHCRDCDPSGAHRLFSEGIVRVLQFEGQDDQGRPVRATARIRFDSSTGPVLR